MGITRDFDRALVDEAVESVAHRTDVSIQVQGKLPGEGPRVLLQAAPDTFFDGQAISVERIS